MIDITVALSRKPLSELSSAQLIERLQGLSMNLFLSAGKLYVPSDIQEAFWETRQAVEKLGPVPPLSVERFIQPEDPFPTFHNAPSSQSVVRYARAKHLEAFTAGQVTLRRASAYKDMRNLAQQDNEMRRTWLIADQPVEIGGNKYHLRQGSLWQDLQKKSGDPADYHILCLSLEESVKLQRVFEADGYVLIHRFREFYEIVTNAIASKYGTTARTSDTVKYYDPLIGPDAGNLRDLVFTKDFSFYYQREARVAILDADTKDEFIQVQVTWPAGLISEIRKF